MSESDKIKKLTPLVENYFLAEEEFRQKHCDELAVMISNVLNIDHSLTTPEKMSAQNLKRLLRPHFSADEIKKVFGEFNGLPNFELICDYRYLFKHEKTLPNMMETTRKVFLATYLSLPDILRRGSTIGDDMLSILQKGGLIYFGFDYTPPPSIGAKSAKIGGTAMKLDDYNDAFKTYLIDENEKIRAASSAFFSAKNAEKPIFQIVFEKHPRWSVAKMYCSFYENRYTNIAATPLYGSSTPEGDYSINSENLFHFDEQASFEGVLFGDGDTRLHGLDLLATDLKNGGFGILRNMVNDHGRKHLAFLYIQYYQADPTKILTFGLHRGGTTNKELDHYLPVAAVINLMKKTVVNRQLDVNLIRSLYHFFSRADTPFQSDRSQISSRSSDETLLAMPTYSMMVKHFVEKTPSESISKTIPHLYNEYMTSVGLKAALEFKGKTKQRERAYCKELIDNMHDRIVRMKSNEEYALQSNLLHSIVEDLGEKPHTDTLKSRFQSEIVPLIFYMVDSGSDIRFDGNKGPSEHGTEGNVVKEYIDLYDTFYTDVAGKEINMHEFQSKVDAVLVKWTDTIDLPKDVEFDVAQNIERKSRLFIQTSVAVAVSNAKNHQEIEKAFSNGYIRPDIYRALFKNKVKATLSRSAPRDIDSENLPEPSQLPKLKGDSPSDTPFLLPPRNLDERNQILDHNVIGEVCVGRYPASAVAADPAKFVSSSFSSLKTYHSKKFAIVRGSDAVLVRATKPKTNVIKCEIIQISADPIFPQSLATSIEMHADAHLRIDLERHTPSIQYQKAYLNAEISRPALSAIFMNYLYLGLNKPNNRVMQIVNEATSGYIPEKKSRASSVCLKKKTKRDLGNACLFSWADIDEFNLAKKENSRVEEEIRIDSEKFSVYISKLTDESLIEQLLEFAENVASRGNDRVIGRDKGTLDFYNKGDFFLKDRIRYLADNRPKDSDVRSHSVALKTCSSVSSTVLFGFGVYNVVKSCIGDDATAKDCVRSNAVITSVMAYSRVESGVSKLAHLKTSLKGLKSGKFIAKLFANSLGEIFDVIAIIESISTIIKCVKGDQQCTDLDIQLAANTIIFSSLSITVAIALTASGNAIFVQLVVIPLVIFETSVSGLLKAVELNKRVDLTFYEVYLNILLA